MYFLNEIFILNLFISSLKKLEFFTNASLKMFVFVILKVLHVSLCDFLIIFKETKSNSKNCVIKYN